MLKILKFLPSLLNVSNILWRLFWGSKWKSCHINNENNKKKKEKWVHVEIHSPVPQIQLQTKRNTYNDFSDGINSLTNKKETLNHQLTSKQNKSCSHKCVLFGTTFTKKKGQKKEQCNNQRSLKKIVFHARIICIIFKTLLAFVYQKLEFNKTSLPSVGKDHLSETSLSSDLKICDDLY